MNKRRSPYASLWVSSLSLFELGVPAAINKPVFADKAIVFRNTSGWETENNMVLACERDALINDWKHTRVKKIIINITTIILLIWEFFIPALVNGFPLESEWQQVSSSLQDSSQYSSWSQQCWSLDGLHSFFYFQVLQSLYQFFDDYRGARGVMVIVAGSEHGDTSSNPGRDWLHIT